MNKVGEADAKYQAAEEPSMDRLPVSDPIVEAVHTSASVLIRLIDDAERPEVWASVRNVATALRWSAMTRPRLPSEHPDGIGPQLVFLRSERRRLSDSVAPTTLRALEMLVEAASSLVAPGDDELAEQIVASAEDAAPGTGCVVLVNAAARAIAEAALSHRLPDTVFLTPRQFTSGHFWKQAVVVGVSSWYPNALFSAPRAEEVVLVHHRWLHDQTEVPGLFGAASARRLVVAMPVQNPARLLPEIVRPPVEQLDWADIEPVDGQPKDNDPSDDVPARLVLLAGGFGFYLEDDADRIRGLDLSRSRGRWIRQLPVADLGQDSVVVLRRGGSERDLLRPRVSRLLGEDECQVRARQAQWKGILAERLSAGGLSGLRRALNMPELTHQYARYWAGDVSICPRASTFTKLLEHLQVPAPEACFEAARKLLNAHLGAGRQLSRDLEALVDDTVASRLEASDSVTLYLGAESGATAITLFRVIAVSPEIVTVPAAAVRSPLKMKGTQWLG